MSGFAHLPIMIAAHSNGQRWLAEVSEAQQIVAELAPYNGHLLSLPAAQVVDRTAVDSVESDQRLTVRPEMIAINRARTNSEHSTLRLLTSSVGNRISSTDFVFGFCCRMYRRNDFDAFWALVARCLAPGGRLHSSIRCTIPFDGTRSVSAPTGGYRCHAATKQWNAHEIVKGFRHVPEQFTSASGSGGMDCFSKTDRTILYQRKWKNGAHNAANKRLIRARRGSRWLVIRVGANRQ